MLVVKFRPLNFNFILGMNGIAAVGGVTVKSSHDVQLGQQSVCGATVSDGPMLLLKIEVVEKDYNVSYEDSAKAWTVKWRWAAGEEPAHLLNGVAEYHVPVMVRAEYESELEKWITEGWLRPYDEEELGKPKGLIPLMAVTQKNKGKVRPVLDYRELNTHVETHTADADVCANKLREWRRMGRNIALLDLRKAYLQVRVHRSLWPYQTVVFRGQRYCLTRLGFGLSIAPMVMKTVVSEVLKQDDIIKEATSPYVDDILVNEDLVASDVVVNHLRQFGLECNPAQHVEKGARVLGLRVGGTKVLQWWRDNIIKEAPVSLTRRLLFSWCGQLVGHLPVCGWLRPAASFIKRTVRYFSDEDVG